MYFPLDPEACRSAARRYREEARLLPALNIRQSFQDLALAYDELADLLEAKEIRVSGVPAD
jgi:hypothetical protein